MNGLVRSAEDRLLMEFLKRQEVAHPDNALETDVFLRRQELNQPDGGFGEGKRRSQSNR